MIPLPTVAAIPLLFLGQAPFVLDVFLRPAVAMFLLGDLGLVAAAIGSAAWLTRRATAVAARPDRTGDQRERLTWIPLAAAAVPAGFAVGSLGCCWGTFPHAGGLGAWLVTGAACTGVAVAVARGRIDAVGEEPGGD